MPGKHNENASWDQARMYVFERLNDADAKSREQDDRMDSLDLRITATETALEVRDARSAWIGTAFGFLGATLGTVIGGWILWKLGVR